MRWIGREWAQAGRGERGFSLLEVLMANIILAVGLLAIAAMQDIALSKNVDAKRMGLATSLAAEMVERIRFNSPANSTASAGVYPYNFTITCTATACTGTPPTTTDATTLSDYTAWRNHLGTPDTSGKLPLPSGGGTVTSTALGPAALGQVLVTVTVSWNTGVRQPTLTLNTVVAPL
jgi:type IV pilus assembly protein PilV